MKNQIKLLNRTCIALFVLFLADGSLRPAVAASNKLDLEMGYFSLKASSARNTGNVSSLGIYRLGYRRVIHPRLDVGLGYTILFSKVITGDSGFGLDVNATYYFYGASHTVESETKNAYLSYEEEVRPWVSLNFAQRNYQSIQTSYAGFGFSGGVDKTLSEKLSARISARYNMLSAGGGATAKELSFNGGIVIEF